MTEQTSTASAQLGAMWDRFIELRRTSIGVSVVKNLIGSAETMRDEFIAANAAILARAPAAAEQTEEGLVHQATPSGDRVHSGQAPASAPLDGGSE